MRPRTARLRHKARRVSLLPDEAWHQAGDPYVEEFSKLGQQECQPHQRRAIDAISLKFAASQPGGLVNAQNARHYAFQERLEGCEKEMLQGAVEECNEEKWESLMDLCINRMYHSHAT